MESPDDIIAFTAGLPGVAAVTASEENGAPEAAWGDVFFFHDPDGDPANRRMPFATIVTHDYDGFDTASQLDRPGVFRLNVAVGRAAYERLLGHPPAAYPEHEGRFDPTALDTLIPHPVYAAQSWVAIVCPGEATADLARELLTGAHARAVRRHRPPVR
jgi:Family of unknown function (DUF6194)